MALSLLALAASATVTLFCAAVIRHTAALPPGDVTAMQWVVLTPLAILFSLVAVPTLIVGVTRLQALRLAEAVDVARRSRKRTLKLLLVSRAVIVGLLPAVSTIAGLLLGVLK